MTQNDCLRQEHHIDLKQLSLLGAPLTVTSTINVATFFNDDTRSDRNGKRVDAKLMIFFHIEDVPPPTEIPRREYPESEERALDLRLEREEEGDGKTTIHFYERGEIY